MLSEAFIGQSNRSVVPALPVACLVASDEEDRLPRGVEGKEHPHLAGAGRGRSEFLHIVVAAAMDSVDEWPPCGGAFVCELVDRILDEVRGLWIARADPEVPGLHLGMEADLPAHPTSIRYLSYLASAGRR